MKIYHSIPSLDGVKEFVEKYYEIKVSTISLFRDMIGSVYRISTLQKQYILKLYRSFDEQVAIQASRVNRFLDTNGFPVPTIQNTLEGRPYCSISMPEGKRIGILSEYIQGENPTKERDLETIGKLTALMHQQMKSYPHSLRVLGKAHFIGQFLGHLRDNHCPETCYQEFEEMGSILWDRVSSSFQGFTHGDLHTGNLIKTTKNEIYFLDFDVSSISYPIMDASTISDATDFNVVSLDEMKHTVQNFDQFAKGYTKILNLNIWDEKILLDCIALHHLELNGTIPSYKVPLQGNHWFHVDYFDRHLQWIRKWELLRNKHFG
jgi:Ser/Thr protein kinase RdoA (MazF antagonist)